MRQAPFTSILIFVVFIFSSCKNENNSTDPPKTQNEISGTVKDQNGNPYPNSKIKLYNEIENLQTVTDSKGSFGFDLDKSGFYTIKLIPPLTSTVTSEDSMNIEVQTDEEKIVDFVIRTQPLAARIVADSIDIFGEIRNEAGLIPEDFDELIYARNVFDEPFGLLTPVKTPSGDHVTLSEWKNAQGNIVVNCNGNSTKVDINLDGMIPEGTYTFWLNFLNKKKLPGESVHFASDVSVIEPLGSGTLNVVKAGSDGTLLTSINHPSCILTKEPGLVLVVTYHLNGNTFGAEHIPDAEDVSHMLVYFQ